MFKQNQSRFKWLRWAGTIISLLIFLWLLTQQKWQIVVLYIYDIPRLYLLLATGLYFTGQVANALRWFILLHAPPVQIPFRQTFKISLTGAFVSNFLPSTVGGDAIRFASLFRYTDNRAICLASVALDRFVNVAAFVTILPLSMLTFIVNGSLLTENSLPGAISASAFFTERIGFIQKYSARVYRWLIKTRDAFSIWLKRPFILAAAFLVSWFSIFVVMVAIWLIARGLGISVALYQVMGATAITYFITMLPISVNGLGVREVAITTLYLKLGANIEQATALAVITRLIALTVTFPGALWLPRIFSGASNVDMNQAAQDGSANNDQSLP